MKTKHWVLFQEADYWRIGWREDGQCRIETIDIHQEASPNETAASIAEALGNLGYKGEGVLLAVDSLLCLSASFTLESPGSKRNPQTLLYQLEEFLPLAAEDVAADFIIDGCHVLGVAIDSESEKPLLDELEKQGIYVQSLSPTAVLAVQHLVKIVPSDEPRLVVWQTGDRIEWYKFSANGRLHDWRLFPADHSTLARHLQLEFTHTQQLNVAVCDVSPALQETISSFSEVHLQEIDLDVDLTEAAVIAAEAVLADDSGSWVEFRRGDLDSPDPYRSVRGPMRFAVCGVVALLIAMICGWSYRAYKFKQIADQYQQQQAAAFHEVFPGQSVPLGIRSRLESERTKLAGLKGASGELPARTSALNVFYDALASLPDEMRYRIREMRIDRRRAFIDGEVLSHGDADKISAGMQKRGFQVQPPRTQKLSGKGVSVRIAAETGKESSSRSGAGK